MTSLSRAIIFDTKDQKNEWRQRAKVASSFLLLCNITTRKYDGYFIIANLVSGPYKQSHIEPSAKLLEW
jgi:hypothetical protein